MRRLRKPPDIPVVLALVSGLSGIQVPDIHRYVLITYANDGRAALTSNACCVYHALDDAAQVSSHEQPLLTPCSGRDG